jgi:hypothetical protein
MHRVAPAAQTRATSVSKPWSSQLHKTRGAEYEVACADSQAEAAMPKKEQRRAKLSSKAYKKAHKYPKYPTYILLIRKAQIYEAQRYDGVDDMSEISSMYAHTIRKRAKGTRSSLDIRVIPLAGVFYFHFKQWFIMYEKEPGASLTAMFLLFFLLSEIPVEIFTYLLTIFI